ncbi:MAG: efflux transporter outer membrane subunit [Aureliella sp.]
MKKMVLIATLLMIASSGCTPLKRWKENGYKVGPNYKKPCVQTATDWVDSGHPAVVVQRERNPEWWRAFGDPTLEQLVQAAYQQNLSLRAAGVRVLQARTQLDISALNLLPQSQSHYSRYSRNQISRNTANAFPGLSRSFDDWQTGFDLSWELDVWGRIRRSIEASDANLDVQIELYDDILVTLIGDVAASYIELRAFDQRLALAEENAKIQAGSLDIAKKRNREGRVSELDVTQATSNYADTLALIPSLRQGRRQAMNRIALLVGMTPFELEPLLRERGSLPDVPEQAVVGIPAELLRRRPDIRAAERQVAAQSAQIGIAEAELYPQFGLTGDINLNSERFSDLFSGASNGGLIAPGIRWNFLNYGRLKRGVRIEQLQFQEAVVNYENSVLAAHREVEDAMVQFLESKERAEQLQRSAEAAAKSVELVSIQYKEGEVDFGRVFVLELSLVQRQDQLVATEAEVAIALVRLYKALGGGWQIRLTDPYRGSYPTETLASLPRNVDLPDLPIELDLIEASPPVSLVEGPIVLEQKIQTSSR